jgi:hypothetical protein
VRQQQQFLGHVAVDLAPDVVDPLDHGHDAADGEDPQDRLEQPTVEHQARHQEDGPLGTLQDPDRARQVDRLGLGADVRGHLGGDQSDDGQQEAAAGGPSATRRARRG